ncbi:hypothetical protein CYMTET_40719 [Cymbomonas tetramitiformis]|uniref:Uncharacterized protein n=1 Tax=Cymbomonas tetramitiformis TaxID=36881 RepID=A0AAE0C8T6_9CHLO|nr:hypothetical protein CYMTET_40719 [Cymbomonas tetramitiformis]|eukprot:gene5133-6245_t
MSEENNDAVQEIVLGAQEKTMDTDSIRRMESIKVLREADDSNAGARTEKLGTFMGVFVPTTQNVLGIILFIRLPMITGQAGIIQGSIIVLLSCTMSMLTSISMSAIATSGKVQAGGCYQIIKKSLGPEFGGVVGLLLYLANSFGVAMYVLGFIEPLQEAFPTLTIDEDQDGRIIGPITLLALATIVFIGISYISRFALLFLSGVLLAITSIHIGVYQKTAMPLRSEGITGLRMDTFSDNLGSGYESGESFATMLALFFPAVTDPLAGSNLSGDLKDPSKSIPPGTIMAVLFTSTLFLLQVFFTGGSVERQTLIDEKLIAATIAWPYPGLILAGMMLSTLGAGLQSLAGAPRLLAAIANDRLVPGLHKLAPGPGKEPRKILIMTATISLCCVMLGSLDKVAPFITMWFLTCYGIINGACFLLSYEESPGFRPAWKYYHWGASLAGMVICVSMMFFISWWLALVALTLAGILYKTIQRTQSSGELVAAHGTKKADWASGLRFNQVRKSLLALEQHDVEFKYWRPFLLFICKISPSDGKYIPQKGMINLVSQLGKRGKGLAIVAGIIPAPFDAKHRQIAKEGQALLGETLLAKHIEGFPEVLVAEDTLLGRRFLIQGKGFGVLRPNTVMLGFPDYAALEDKEKEDFLQTCHDCRVAGKTLLICKANEEFPTNDEEMSGTVDIWWIFDLLPAQGLLLLIPFLLTKHKTWSKTKLRLFVVVGFDENTDALSHSLELMLLAAGLTAEVKILQMQEGEAPRYHTVNRTVAFPLDAKPNMPKKDKGALMELSKYISSVAIEVSEDAQDTKTADPDSSLQQPSPILQADPVPPHINKDKYGSKLTGLLKEKSGDSALVLISLPRVRPAQGAEEYLDSLATLVADLPRVVFVQESGDEKVQLYA